MILSLLFGGISWLYFAVGRNHNHFVRVTTVSIAVLTGLAILSLPGDIGVKIVVGHGRFYILAELLIMAIVGPTIILGLKRGHTTTFVTCILAIILLLFLSFSAVSAPDHPNTPRTYLTESESLGKEFSNEYAVHSVHTDSYYASETINFGNPNGQTAYQALDYELFNKTIGNTDFKHIAYRTDVGVYRLQSGIFENTNYRLDWDPKPTLDHSSNRIYDNNRVIHYTRS